MNAFAELQRDLQRHIVDGDRRIATAIDSTPEVSADTRLQIYSDAYRLRLIEGLQANYPVLERLVGADRFARIAQLYLSLHPSRHFSVRWFGHDLPAFLREFDECRDEPWLAELAEWEWRIAAAFDAADSTTLTADALAKVAPEDWPALRFALTPSVSRCTLTTNVATIVKALNEECDPPVPEVSLQTEWLIWRQDLSVLYRSLDRAEAAALAALAAGADFGEICDALSNHIEIDLVPTHAAGLLRAWIDAQLLVESAK